MRVLVGLLFSLVFSTSLFAQEVAPDALVRAVTEDVLAVVKTDKDLKSGDTRKAVALVEERVLPHFNFTRMTQLAMARAWRQATPAQKTSLINEFRELLVRTYSKALTEYKDQAIVYKPFSLKAGETDTKVRTEIRQVNGGKPIELDYYLEKSAAAWQVYDIEVGGISLVMNYRDTFASEIRTGGIEGLIKTLQAKNGASDAVPAKK